MKSAVSPGSPTIFPASHRPPSSGSDPHLVQPDSGWQDLIQARRRAGLLLGVYTHRPPLRGVECTIGITSEQSHEHKRKDLHRDRKSTRLNSSHVKISYAVFCLKKKKKK